MASPLLRWCWALLAASGLCYLTWLLTTLLLGVVLPGAPEGAPSGLGRLLGEAFPHAAAGAAFVYLATKLAPPRRQAPLIAFLAFIAILAALVLFRVLALPSGHRWVDVAAVLLGAGSISLLLLLRPPLRGKS